MAITDQGKSVFLPVFLHAVVVSPQSEGVWAKIYIRPWWTPFIPISVVEEVVRPGDFGLIYVWSNSIHVQGATLLPSCPRLCLWNPLPCSFSPVTTTVSPSHPWRWRLLIWVKYTRELLLCNTFNHHHHTIILFGQLDKKDASCQFFCVPVVLVPFFSGKDFLESEGWFYFCRRLWGCTAT